jgi:hypothetical protein
MNRRAFLAGLVLAPLVRLPAVSPFWGIHRSVSPALLPLPACPPLTREAFQMLLAGITDLDYDVRLAA